MGVVYQKAGFVVVKRRKDYVVINTNMRFKEKEGHTHLYSYKSAIDAVNFVINRKIPNKTSPNYLSRLQRITTDKKYKSRLETRKTKSPKQNYKNRKKFK